LQHEEGLFTVAALATVAFSAGAVAAAPASEDGVQVTAAPTASQRVGYAHGTGAGRTSVGMVHFEVSAHERLTGDSGQIGVRVSTPTQEVSYSIDVTCANMQAPFAGQQQGLIQGIVDRVTPVPNVLGVTVGQRRLTFIADRGEPSSPTPVDFFGDFVDFIPPDTCKFFTSTSGLNVEQGNIEIKGS
jgi:hypothetical protein